MSLAQGRHYLAIPGPSVIPDRVLQAMQRPAPNIYAGELPDMMPGICADLKSIARTDGQCAIYIANGHGAWEAALSNVASRGDKVLILATGRFGHGWAEIAQAMHLDVEVISFGKRAPVDAARVADRLAADTKHEIKAVLTVQTDTSTSIRNEIKPLRDALDGADHPALLMVDCIACLACDRFEMDAWGADVMVTACQKGLMTPPGLSFVFFNERADAARETADLVTRYWDWRPRARPEHFYQFFGGTAATHHVYGLRAALDMIAEEGLEHVWDRHAQIARAVWAAFERWGADGPLEMNVADPAMRSHAVTALRIGAPHGTRLRDWLSSETGLTLGIGLGMADPASPDWHGFFRLGHMGHVNAHMILGALGAIDAGLKALEIPHGRGALEAAAEVCAGR